MSLPDRQSIKLALLEVLSDQRVHRSAEIDDKLIRRFELTPEQRAEVTKAGRTKFGNEIDWVKVDLGKRAFINKVMNRHYQITPLGLEELKVKTTPRLADSPEDVSSSGLGSDFEKEVELQRALRANIEQTEVGLKITDGGREAVVASGRIDITAQDREGNTVLIELKSGIADRDAVAQIASYLGDSVNSAHGLRGMLIAHDFSPRALSAARMVSCLELHRYGYRFTFEKM